MYRELKNLLPSLVQKTHFPVRGPKINRYMGGRIGVMMEKRDISCTPIPMVPHLHQSNGYIKGKLRVWRAQKCIASSVHKTRFPFRGRKVPRYMWGGIGLRMEICEISCTPIPMVPRSHQNNGYIKGKLRVWRAQKCVALVGAENPLTSSGPKNIPLHVWRYRTENGNIRNFVHPNTHGTAFPPKQWIYQREAPCMESSKLYCPRRCRKHTYLCVVEKFPATWGAYRSDD